MSWPVSWSKDILDVWCQYNSPTLTKHPVHGNLNIIESYFRVSPHIQTKSVDYNRANSNEGKTGDVNLRGQGWVMSSYQTCRERTFNPEHHFATLYNLQSLWLCNTVNLMSPDVDIIPLLYHIPQSSKDNDAHHTLWNSIDFWARSSVKLCENLTNSSFACIWFLENETNRQDHFFHTITLHDQTSVCVKVMIRAEFQQ